MKAGDEEKIYKLFFKGEIPPIVVVSGTLKSRLLVMAVNKIRNYLAYKNNANYTYQKMLPLCKTEYESPDRDDQDGPVQPGPGRYGDKEAR